MARIRTVKPEFWDDEKIGALPPLARLLFIATWNYADDEGLVRWAPEHLKFIAFRYDDISAGDVQGLMADLTSAGLVFAYQAGASRQRVGYIVNFRKHQKVNRPNPGKLVPPSLANPQVALMYVERDGYVCYLCGDPIPRQHQFDGDPYSPTDGPPVLVSPVNPSLDHVTPRSKGGTDYPSNIRAAHIGCNKGRRDRSTDEFTVPASVVTALEWLKAERPEVLSDSPNDSPLDPRSDSLSDSVIEVVLPVVDTRPRSTHGDEQSVNNSVSETPPEGKGREGKGEEVPPTAGAKRPAPKPTTPGAPDTAQTLIGEWIGSCRKRPPTATIGPTSKAIKNMLEEGIDPDDIRTGLTLWSAKGLNPAALPSVVNGVMNAAPMKTARSPQNQFGNAGDWQMFKTGTDDRPGVESHLRAITGGDQHVVS